VCQTLLNPTNETTGASCALPGNNTEIAPKTDTIKPQFMLIPPFRFISDAPAKTPYI
jgi:hypothetical protein